jgi:glucose/arabinose dehydrogenase
MNRFIMIGLIACSAAMAQDQATPAPKPAPAPKKTTAVKKAAPKVAAPKVAAPKVAAKPAPAVPVAQPLTIPTDATANPDGTYSYTDKAGKQWTYSKTPFGVSKTQTAVAGSGGAMAAAPMEQTVKSTDRGDTVLFEKPSPFGTSKWEKKKSELTDEERSIFQSQHPDKQ